MELIARLRSWALGAPHVLLVEALDGTARRLEAERVVRARGWTLCDAPVDADILLVCGEIDKTLAPDIRHLRQAMTEPAAQPPGRFQGDPGRLRSVRFRSSLIE